MDGGQLAHLLSEKFPSALLITVTGYGKDFVNTGIRRLRSSCHQAHRLDALVGVDSRGGCPCSAQFILSRTGSRRAEQCETAQRRHYRGDENAKFGAVQRSRRERQIRDE